MKRLILEKIIKPIFKILEFLVYIILFILFFVAIFINRKFGNISFEQLLYNITNTQGANYDVVYEGIFFVSIILLILDLVIYIFYRILKSLNFKVYFNIGFKQKIKKFDIFKTTAIKSILILFIFSVFTLYSSIKILNIDEYVSNQFNSTKLFEEYYVDGATADLKFPKKKRNLIYIFLESIETTNASVENGGLVEKSYIPKLEKLALENINFSNSDNLGGAFQVSNTSWTVAGIAAHTAGIPLRIPVDSYLYKSSSKQLPGSYNLGDILYENGYNNYFMIGSDAEFGSRRNYFESHGNYTIYDYYYARENKLIGSNYYVWWGYEDKKLFKFAKEKILEASKKDEPFNFTLLTVDTHFTDGYMDSSCEEVFDSKYANAIYCSDSKVYSFIKWIQKQDFYDNTTIIMTGDHLTMQSDFYQEREGYDRTIYNVFINSPIKPKKEKNRQFSSFDMFPTTLAALGVEIKGDRLGLGVNLFSDKKTLIEELGFDYFDSELAKKSFYYDNVILGDTYYEMEEYNKNH